MKRLNSQLQQDGAPLELILLIRTLLAGCKEISFRVSQGALAGVLGFQKTYRAKHRKSSTLSLTTF